MCRVRKNRGCVRVRALDGLDRGVGGDLPASVEGRAGERGQRE